MTTASAKELREAAQLLTELAGDARSVKAPKIADTNELAAALCIERAEQMERGEQSFSDWLTSQYSIIDMAKRAELKAAWHAATATTKSERDQAIESIRQCRVFLRGCMNHAYDETPIVEVAKDVSAEFHRNRYQLQCMAKERDDIAKERDAANLLLKRLMCVVVPDNAVPNDMKEFVRDSSATVLKDLWDYLKTDTDLRKAKHDAR